jgi:hypothetical protein
MSNKVIKECIKCSRLFLGKESDQEPNCGCCDEDEEELKEFRCPYMKTEWGEFVIMARNEKEAKENILDADEHANKSDYDYDLVELYEAEKPFKRSVNS